MATKKSHSLDAVAPTAGVAGAQSVQRTASLLRVLALNNRDGLRLVDAARLTGVERPSVHRLLQGLVAAGLAAQHANRRYFLGPALFEMVTIAAPTFNVVDICKESVRRLAQSVQDTVYLTVQTGVDAVCVDRQVGNYPIRVFTLEVGERRPMGVGAGSIAMLAAMSPEEADSIVRANSPYYGQYEGVTAPMVQEFVAQTRERGYLARLGRINPDVKTIGVAVTMRNGRPIAGLSIAATQSRIPESREQELLATIRDEVALIQARLNEIAYI
jgi:DNA-binding IclR family transcriptional regulator